MGYITKICSTVWTSKLQHGQIMQNYYL